MRKSSNKDKPMKLVDIFTDGACSRNPGPGGWAAILKFEDGEKQLSGSERSTTNNRMELMAAIAALESLESPYRVRITTDSQYLKLGITEWIHNWKKRGWRTAGKTRVKNVDLWKRLDALVAKHDVQWDWVYGHSGHEENELADQLARRAIKDMGI